MLLFKSLPVALLLAVSCASAPKLPVESTVFAAGAEEPAYTSQILQLSAATPPAEPEGHDHGKALPYVCPMHEDVQSDKPGKCPKCGMKLKLREDAHEHH